MAERLSPKLVELCKWKNIQEVNNKLDAGESPNSVCTYINKNGFKISNPLIYEYSKMRKKALVDGLNIEHMIGIARKPLVEENVKTKLKSEIDALDRVIQQGYHTLLEWNDRPINPKTMMDAIKLKSELTDGNHGFLTNYGMEQLRAIEQNKYELIIEHLISCIPDAKKNEAVDKIGDIEFDYYKSTDYFEEYLRASGEYTEVEIQKLLEENYKEQNDEESSDDEQNDE